MHVWITLLVRLLSSRHIVPISSSVIMRERSPTFLQFFILFLIFSKYIYNVYLETYGAMLWWDYLVEGDQEIRDVFPLLFFHCYNNTNTYYQNSLLISSSVFSFAFIQFISLKVLLWVYTGRQKGFKHNNLLFRQNEKNEKNLERSVVGGSEVKFCKYLVVRLDWVYNFLAKIYYSSFNITVYQLLLRYFAFIIIFLRELYTI